MARDTPVTEVMTSDVLSLHVDTTVEEAVREMSERGVSGAPVVDDDGRLIGLLDDSDLILSEAKLHAPTTIELFGAYLTLPREAHCYEDQLRHALASTVGEAMDDEPHTVGPHATVEEVATIMVDRGVSRVPVLDERRHVVGIVTRSDIVGSLYRRET